MLKNADFLIKFFTGVAIGLFAYAFYTFFKIVML